MHMYRKYMCMWLQKYGEKIQKGTHEEVHIGYWRSVGEHAGGRGSLKGEAKKKKEKEKDSSKKA